MANRQRGDVAIQAGDSTYTMRLTTAAMVDLEDACSTPDRPMVFPEILDRVTAGSVKYVRLFVWAALKHHHPDITVEDAGRVIDEAGGLVAMGAEIHRVSESLTPDAEDRIPQTTQATNPLGTGATSTSKPEPST